MTLLSLEVSVSGGALLATLARGLGLDHPPWGDRGAGWSAIVIAVSAILVMVLIRSPRPEQLPQPAAVRPAQPSQKEK
jgi:hypothetical protein